MRLVLSGYLAVLMCFVYEQGRPHGQTVYSVVLACNDGNTNVGDALWGKVGVKIKGGNWVWRIHDYSPYRPTGRTDAILQRAVC